MFTTSFGWLPAVVKETVFTSPFGWLPDVGKECEVLNPITLIVSTQFQQDVSKECKLCPHRHRHRHRHRP